MKMNNPLNDLKKRISKYGDQTLVADDLGISKQLINDVLSGRRCISTQLAKKLGYRREFIYTPIRSK